MPSHAGSAEQSSGQTTQTGESLASRIQTFLEDRPHVIVREDGKVVFDLRDAQWRVDSCDGVCTLELWSGERTLTRRVVGIEARGDALRLATVRLGHAQTKLLELAPAIENRREPKAREADRRRFLETLERALRRTLPEWQPESLRASMDLERSFGPAYARGLLALAEGRKQRALALIGVGPNETQATIDGILTAGILWLDHLRRSGDGRRRVEGLALVLPKDAETLTLSRLRWLNEALGEWRLFCFDPIEGEMIERDPLDQGNLQTRLIQAPDATAAEERFREAREAVLALTPPGEQSRVEVRLRSSTETAFLLHGLLFARAELEPAARLFTHHVRVFVGVGPNEQELSEANREALRMHIAELFRRRDPALGPGVKARRPSLRGAIGASGAFRGKAVHARLREIAPQLPLRADETAASRRERLTMRERAGSAQRDPLFRAAPERWLESVLRANLAALTRGLGPQAEPLAGAASSGLERRRMLRAAAARAVHDGPDAIGNRVDVAQQPEGATPSVLPRLDPRHVYTQVPAIAGASDRGMLDLLGVTADGRLAVIEIKASDDMHHALQALDYWIRVRHHHREHDGEGELQRHGYFRGIELSPLPPRLYLVAPALHIHPATEVVLRFLSPEVEWTLIALDERWRSEISVVWRRSGGGASTS